MIYDAFNRLIERTIGSSKTRFYYDDQWRVVAEYDENDSLVAKYVYGPEIDEPVRMTRSGTTYYYHAAALGTVTDISDSSGNLAERYQYDVYGMPKMWDGSGNLLSSSAIGNRLLFQGRDCDQNTGLYNFRNRYYSPMWGRFVQVDGARVKIWLDSDSPPSTLEVNTYLFVGNNSVTQADPLGLWQICTPWCKAGGGLKCRICIGNKIPGEPEPKAQPDVISDATRGSRGLGDTSLINAHPGGAESLSTVPIKFPFPIFIWIQCKF